MTSRWTLMTGVILIVLALWVNVASAESCPATIDPQVAPYGGCICGAMGIPSGGVDCPVVLNGSTLSCGCQSAGNTITCQDPNIKRCGGILPQCNAFDICDLNTATTCWDAHSSSTPAYAPGCYIGSTHLVDPTKCTCVTVTVRLPKSPEQRTAYQNCSNLAGRWATQMFALSYVNWVVQPMIFITGALGVVFGAEAVRCQALANDPPRTDYTVVTTPFCVDPGYAATLADGWGTQDRVDVVNNLLTAASCLVGASKRVLNAMERYDGARVDAAPYWMGVQRSEWTQAALDQQAKAQWLKSALWLMVDPTYWDADTISKWAQIVNATDMATLNQFKNANLVPGP